ncbi:MAG TPA: hypothetical protein VK631_07415 [Solirubrobacteraceae bacterium]|nr:hypothetical protein [Solirubrobacteraceae bacterium]
MPFSVSLADNTPSPRYGTPDPGVWTQARWEEAAARSGPWTAVETQTLTPAYTDPALPPSYDLTSEQITAYPGWIRLVWLDAGGVQEPTEPVFVGSAIRPSVQEVANLMPDRTTLPHAVNGQNEEAGTFTADTRPSAAQVDALIDLNLDAIDSKVPADASGEVQRSARSIVALHTAILAEATYFSHQGEVNTARIEL